MNRISIIRVASVATLLLFVPLTAEGQSAELTVVKHNLDLELATLYGNLEVLTGPNVEQMRTRLRNAREAADRMNTQLGRSSREARAVSELESLDRELLLLQGMLEGSYVSARDIMLGRIGTCQSQIAELRNLLGVAAPVAESEETRERGRRGQGRRGPDQAQPEVQEPEPTTERDRRGQGGGAAESTPVEIPVVNPMDAAAFSNLLGAVSGQAFSDGRLGVLRTAAARNHFTVAQVSQLVALMDFGSDKIETVVICWPRIVDQENIYLVYGQFDFDSDVTQLRRRLGL